jgi:lipid-A-disaccharide synthase
MKYYIIAGEASGDLHASNLIRELKQRDAKADFRCWGGDLMQQQGAVIVKHYRELSFMGFTEVLMNLGTILHNLSFCKKDILNYRPDGVILVDYPGFNLRIAKFLHQNGLPVIYYISPQVWAWKQSRVRTIRKVVDKMLVILPFEKDFYSGHGVEVEFIGHPLLDALSGKPFVPVAEKASRPLVALLPGSRRQEIRAVLPEMLKVIARFPEVDFIIAGVTSVDDSFYAKLAGKQKAAVLKGRTYDLLNQSSAALVTSGTATLETALIGTPEVVCYRGGAISYMIARKLVKVKFISLVNLIMDRVVVKEFIQHELTADNLERELRLLLYDNSRKTAIMNDYGDLRQKLGGPGASARAAATIVEFLKLRLTDPE